jgi:hypothetical protein
MSKSMQPDNKKLDDDKIREILKEFDVENEDELTVKINSTWNLTRCIKCNREIDLLECSFLDGDPICKGGCLG